MSNLLVQNIKHTNNTTAQTIDTSGRTTALLNNDTTYRSDSGAVTQNLVLGLVKLSSSCSDAAATNGAFNVSGGTDHGTGDYSYAPINNFANNFTKYSGIIRDTSPGQVATRNNARHDVSVIAYETANASGSNADLSHEINVFGDLA